MRIHLSKRNRHTNSKNGSQFHNPRRLKSVQNRSERVQKSCFHARESNRSKTESKEKQPKNEAASPATLQNGKRRFSRSDHDSTRAAGKPTPYIADTSASPLKKNPAGRWKAQVTKKTTIRREEPTRQQKTTTAEPGSVFKVVAHKRRRQNSRMSPITQETYLRTAGRIETANITSETTGSRPESKPESHKPQNNTANAALIKAAMPWLLLSPEQQAALAGMPDEEKRILAVRQLELKAHKANQRPKQAIPDVRKLNTTNRLGRPETPHENSKESAEKSREATEQQQQRQQNQRRRRPDFRRTVRSWSRYDQIAAERIVAHICRRRRCFESVRNMANSLQNQTQPLPPVTPLAS